MNRFEEIFLGIAVSAYFIAFMIKNVITRIRTKQPVRGRSVKMNLVTLNIIILAIIIYSGIASHPDYFYWIRVLDSDAVRITGLIIISLAFILGISTLIKMKDSWRVGIRPEQKTELITSGVFRYSRNPYFLSYDLLFLGMFLEFPTLAFLVFSLTFVIILHFLILDEEKYLLEQHGDTYKKYKDSVKRYFMLRIGHKK